jgi:hypothetical protein
MTVSRRVVVILVLGASIAPAERAAAQAWLPGKGEGWVGLSYQNLGVDDHLMSDGRSLFDGRIRAHTLLIDGAYGVTDRLTISGSLPYVTSKYDGTDPEAPIDNGSYHGAFQDFGLGVAFTAFRDPIVVTPFVETGMPSHPYDTMGHSVIGKDLRELRFGANLGRQGVLLPDAYLQVRYGYSFVERVPDMEQRVNRSNLDVQLGYVVTRSISAIVVGNWQWTHGGIDWDTLTDAQFMDHDRAARANFFRLVGVVTYSVNRSFQMFVSYGGVVHGENTHAGRGVSIGTTFNFFPKHSLPPKSTDATSASPDKQQASRE